MEVKTAKMGKIGNGGKKCRSKPRGKEEGNTIKKMGKHETSADNKKRLIFSVLIRGTTNKASKNGRSSVIDPLNIGKAMTSTQISLKPSKNSHLR